MPPSSAFLTNSLSAMADAVELCCCIASVLLMEGLAAGFGDCWGWGDMAPGLAWANAAMQVNRSAPENVAILQILWEIIGGVPPWRGNSRACTEPMASGCKLALPSNRDFDPSYNGMPRPRPRVAWRASAFPRSRH